MYLKEIYHFGKLLIFSKSHILNAKELTELLGNKIVMTSREVHLVVEILLLSCSISHHLLMNAFGSRNIPYNVKS